MKGSTVLSEASALQALYNAPIPVIIARDDGAMLHINKAFQAVTGLCPEDIASLDDWSSHLLRYPQHDEPICSATFFASAQHATTFHVTLVSAADEPLVWEIFNAQLEQAHGTHPLVISFALDVTEKISQQQHVEKLMHDLEQEVSSRTQDLRLTIKHLETEVSERKRVSDALALSRKRLQRISRRTLDILEADRRSISTELHDSIGASLAAIKFSLEDKELQRSKNKGIVSASLDQEIHYLGMTIKETKRISANLRPSTLDDLGLMATIEWYLRHYQRMYDTVTIDYRAEIAEEDVPEYLKINIYRIIQEGLNNAGKHSGARTVRVYLEFCDGGNSIALSIRDDGCGFDVNDIFTNKDPLSGHGLVTMRERCELFGGSFHLDSTIGSGTIITATLPVS